MSNITDAKKIIDKIDKKEKIGRIVIRSATVHGKNDCARSTKNCERT